MMAPWRGQVRWLPFLGPKLGLAKALRSLAIDPDDFDLHQVFPVVTSLAGLLDDQGEFEPRAGGAAITLEGAINRAMGELLERYASFVYEGANRSVASYTEMIERGHRAVPFNYLIRFTPQQHRQKRFPYVEFTKATSVDWVEGVNLLDGEATFVPSQLILFDSRQSESLAPCFYATSSGCALATSVKEAVLKGIFELIERDAVMIRWYARLAPPRLNINPWDLLAECISSQARELEIRLHDLTVDGEVPVVGATCIERTERPCFFLLSAASALDISTAASKAFVEAGQGRPFIKSMAGKSVVPTEERGFNDFDSNVRFYGEPSNAKYVEWFVQNPTLSSRDCIAAQETKTPAESLKILLDRCTAKRITPIAFNLTTPEMYDTGLFACRVFAPELAPLGIPSAPFLGHPRLARFIASNNAAHPAAGIPDWIPHPFP